MRWGCSRSKWLDFCIEKDWDPGRALEAERFEKYLFLKRRDVKELFKNGFCEKGLRNMEEDQRQISTVAATTSFLTVSALLYVFA